MKNKKQKSMAGKVVAICGAAVLALSLGYSIVYGADGFTLVDIFRGLALLVFGLYMEARD